MSGHIKDAMGSFTTGVTVVTTRFDGADWGMTCNSFNTVSLDPPMVLWSIRKESSSHRAFLHSGGFAISILNSHQKELALRFTRGTHEERFAGTAIERTPDHRARLANALAWFDCKLVQVVSAGDHDILIGQVLDHGRTEGEGLAYARRTFGVLAALA
jgi:flavin reductase (DIM6/NTAB) family NADH-FMN oxidoreductase RutF